MLESKCLNLELAPICSMLVNYYNKGNEAIHGIKASYITVVLGYLCCIIIGYLCYYWALLLTLMGFLSDLCNNKDILLLL